MENINSIDDLKNYLLHDIDFVKQNENVTFFSESPYSVVEYFADYIVYLLNTNGGDDGRLDLINRLYDLATGKLKNDLGASFVEQLEDIKNLPTVIKYQHLFSSEMIDYLKKYSRDWVKLARSN